MYLEHLYTESHPTMGAWIEIRKKAFLYEGYECRTPRWVRGLKFIRGGKGGAVKGSHPTMGAWIEIKMDDWSKSTDGCRTPRWVRGLKYKCF